MVEDQAYHGKRCTYRWQHGSVCREYLIIVGSIPNGAGTMVLWFCSFLGEESADRRGARPLKQTFSASLCS